MQEGSTVLIECPLPHSVPQALPRLRVRGERIEVSTGWFENCDDDFFTRDSERTDVKCTNIPLQPCLH